MRNFFKLGKLKYSRMIAIAFVIAILCSILFASVPTYAAPSDRYWVGGSGNWSDTAHWDYHDGGAGGDPVPDWETHVYVNSNSDTGAGFTITINVAATCGDIDFSLVDQIPTLAGSSTLGIYGSVVLVNTMVRTYTGAITFASTGAETLSFTTITMASSINFNGVGGSWQLVDALNNGTSQITLTNGTLDTNGQTVT